MRADVDLGHGRLRVCRSIGTTSSVPVERRVERKGVSYASDEEDLTSAEGCNLGQAQLSGLHKRGNLRLAWILSNRPQTCCSGEYGPMFDSTCVEMANDGSLHWMVPPENGQHVPSQMRNGCNDTLQVCAAKTRKWSNSRSCPSWVRAMRSPLTKLGCFELPHSPSRPSRPIDRSLCRCFALCCPHFCAYDDPRR